VGAVVSLWTREKLSFPNRGGTEKHVARLQALLATTRTMDPTRPFLDSSGYTHFLPEADVFDAHDYEQNPEAFAARYALFGATGCDPWHNNPVEPRNCYRGQPFFVSEYGGIHVKTARDTGTGWGYDGAGLSDNPTISTTAPRNMMWGGCGPSTSGRPLTKLSRRESAA
jgi:hypothetical protein